MNVDLLPQGLVDYGIAPALITLKKLQEEERFEECAVLKKHIDDHIKSLDESIAHKFTSSVDDEYIENLLQYAPQESLPYIPIYVRKFEKFIEI
jgi:hypothetical protein